MKIAIPTSRRVTLLACLLLAWAPCLALAAERTATLVVDDTELVVPVPDGYVQASIELPAWIAQMRALTTPGSPQPIETLMSATCVDDADAGAYCRTAYDLQVSRRRFDPAMWSVMRPQLVELVQKQSKALIDRAMAQRDARLRELEIESEATLESTTAIIMLAPDDLRGVRFRLPTPAVIKEEGVEVRQWRFGGQVMLRGRLFSVIVTRELAEGEDAEAVAKAMEAELDAFVQRLYALNPMYATH